MEIEYPRILEQAEAVSSKASPFPLKIQGASLFGSHGEDRVLFLDIPFSDELARLKKLCPWPSDKPFSPHITIARISHPQRFAVVKKKVLKEVENASFEMTVDLLRLYAEINNAKQTPLRDFPFGDQPSASSSLF
jgi:2'-5' RNA ligase